MLKIKRIQIIVLLMLYAINALSAETGGIFKITGHIANMQTGKIFLDYTVDNRNVLDSAKIVDGNFELTGKISHPTVAFFMLNKNIPVTSSLYIYLEPSMIKVELNGKPFSTVKISGSKTNDEYSEWVQGYLKFKHKAANARNQEDIEKDAGKRKALEDSIVRFNAYMDSLTFNFAVSHPQSFVTPYVLYIHYRSCSMFQLKKIYNNLTGEIANSVYGKVLLQHINSMTANTVGDQAAEISAADYIDNTQFSLKAQKGKYVLIDFWGSWCVPCIKLIPSLVEEHNKYKNKDIVFVSVCRDYNGNMDKCRKIAKESGMNWVNLWDSQDKTDQNDITALYNVGVYPTAILIGPDGKILERGDGSDGYLKCKARLEKVLNGSPAAP